MFGQHTTQEDCNEVDYSNYQKKFDGVGYNPLWGENSPINYESIKSIIKLLGDRYPGLSVCDIDEKVPPEKSLLELLELLIGLGIFDSNDANSENVPTKEDTEEEMEEHDKSIDENTIPTENTPWQPPDIKSPGEEPPPGIIAKVVWVLGKIVEILDNTFGGSN